MQETALERLIGFVRRQLDPNSEPIRVAYIVLGAVLAVLAVFGVTDGSVVELLGQLAALCGAGEAARRKATPEKRAVEREASAYRLGRKARR